MSPQFPKRSSQPLSPVSIRASVKRGRALIGLIERYADPQTPHEKTQLTCAINGMSRWAQSLSQRHRQIPVSEMAMLPNDHHPSARCSCAQCLRAYPERPDPDRPKETDYAKDEGWLFANHVEAYYARRLSDCELSLRVYDDAEVSEYWLRHPTPVDEGQSVECLKASIDNSLT